MEVRWITDGNPTTGAGYARVSQMFTQVSNYFPGHILFTGAQERLIFNKSNGMLTAFRCGDRTFRLRFFGGGDMLYNVFFKPPLFLSKAVTENLYP